MRWLVDCVAHFVVFLAWKFHSKRNLFILYVQCPTLLTCACACAYTCVCTHDTLNFGQYLPFALYAHGAMYKLEFNLRLSETKSEKCYLVFVYFFQHSFSIPRNRVDLVPSLIFICRFKWFLCFQLIMLFIANRIRCSFSYRFANITFKPIS